MHFSDFHYICDQIKSHPKPHQILDVFGPPKFVVSTPSKIYKHVITPASQHVAW